MYDQYSLNYKLNLHHKLKFKACDYLTWFLILLYIIVKIYGSFVHVKPNAFDRIYCHDSRYQNSVKKLQNQLHHLKWPICTEWQRPQMMLSIYYYCLWNSKGAFQILLVLLSVYCVTSINVHGRPFNTGFEVSNG